MVNRQHLEYSPMLCIGKSTANSLHTLPPFDNYSPFL